MKTKPPRPDVRPAAKEKLADDIARTLKLDKGLGFLVRLLDTRVHLLYEQLTGQNDITPRQFGVLLTLHQQGTLTLTELAGHGLGAAHGDHHVGAVVLVGWPLQ